MGGPIPRLPEVATMSKIIVLTDLHIVPEGRTVAGVASDMRLARAIAHINRWHGDADRVVITGDLTHHGDAASYDRLRPLLAALRPPVTITIGNHDDRAAFRAAFPEVPVDGEGHVQTVVDLADVRLVVLDSVFDPPHPPGLRHAGRLCAGRLGFLDRALAGAGGRPAIVFLHHPPFATGFPGMDAIALQEPEGFFGVLDRHRATVRQIVAGHVHRTVSGSHRGYPFAIFKSPAHQQPGLFDAASSSLSTDEPGAYGILLVTGEGLLVHTEDFDLADHDRIAVHA